jgi:hypothetical protein
MYDEEPKPDFYEEFWREIILADGSSYYVDSRFHPMISEWDWQYDPVSEQVVRYEDGRKKSIYEEQLRWHQRQKVNLAAPQPTLSRKEIRAQFGHLPAFRTLLVASQRQREITMFQEGWNLPMAQEFLAEALSDALLLYYEWQSQDNIWTFVPDETGLTPGQLQLQPKDERKYETLGQWMKSEYTGDWVKSNKAPTGLEPQTFRKYLQARMMDMWRTLVMEANFFEITARKVERVLRGAGRPAFLTVRHARDLVGHYPIG